jgi:hypothetical protein
MLKFGLNTAQIKKLNLRLEAHGQDVVKACDVRTIIHCKDGAKVLDGLSIGQLSLWDSEGAAQLQELMMQCRHAIEDAAVEFSGGDTAAKLRGKVDKIKVRALDDHRVELDVMVKINKISNTNVGKLFDLWLGGDCRVSVAEQADLKAVA